LAVVPSVNPDLHATASSAKPLVAMYARADSFNEGATSELPFAAVVGIASPSAPKA
jgi:hypothetical protein